MPPLHLPPSGPATPPLPAGLLPVRGPGALPPGAGAVAPLLGQSRLLDTLARGVGTMPSMPAPGAGAALGHAARAAGDLFSADGEGGRVVAAQGDLRLVETRDGLHPRIEARHDGAWTTVAPVERAADGALQVDGALLERAGLGEMALPPGWGIGQYRTAEGFPEFDTHSTRARRRATHAVPGLQNWQAHHLLPFNVITQLPFDQRAAIANSGWRMDSPENIVAVPGDMATYRALPNGGFLPYHSGPHPKYDAIVGGALRAALADVSNMTANEIREALKTAEREAFLQLTSKEPWRPPMHPRIN